jgi:FlaA1/EpsC-like NDP-sugar epimerase
VQLVLHAAAIGGPGSLFVLEMGEQIKLVDMARNLIRLSGFVPEQEIPISFIGLRPGEKLSESLVSEDEIIEPSPVEKVLRVRTRGAADGARLTPGVLGKLERQAIRGDTEAVLELIGRLVPTFKGAAERWQSRRPLGFSPSAVDRRAAS